MKAEDNAADAVADEVLACEHALNEAMVRGDAETIKRLMSDDIAYVHSTAASESKAEYLAHFAKGFYKYGAIDSKITAVKTYGNTVVITGTHRSKVSSIGVPENSIQTLFVMVWIKQPTGWQLVHRQATRINP